MSSGARSDLLDAEEGCLCKIHASALGCMHCRVPLPAAAADASRPGVDAAAAQTCGQALNVNVLIEQSWLGLYSARQDAAAERTAWGLAGSSRRHERPSLRSLPAHA